ncbi:MAG: hypothetical protein N3H30_01805, partial [Candidatus Micrarchaeota archaeon]|nr:hypothetical protein [Candidatus Micrarchaeota archaeon]
MNARLVLAIMLIASAIVFPACEYVPKMNVSDYSLSSLFPNPGDTLTAVLYIESGEAYSGDIEAVLERGGFEFPLYKGQHYIIPGGNEVRLSGRINRMLGPGVYTLKIRAEGLEFTQDIIVGGENVESAVLPYIAEDQKKIAITLPSNDEVAFTVTVADAAAKQERYMRTIKPKDGAAVLEVPVCSNCRIDITSAYGGGLRVIRKYGAYADPYLRIVGLEHDKIALEGCAPTQYAIYVDGKKYGEAQGISRIEKELATGYEDVRVTMRGQNWELERTISLAGFAYPITEEVRVT